MAFSRILKVGLPAMTFVTTSIAGYFLFSSLGSSETLKKVLIASTTEILEEEEKLAESKTEVQKKWNESYEETLNSVKNFISERVWNLFTR